MFSAKSAPTRYEDFGHPLGTEHSLRGQELANLPAINLGIDDDHLSKPQAKPHVSVKSILQSMTIIPPRARSHKRTHNVRDVCGSLCAWTGLYVRSLCTFTPQLTKNVNLFLIQPKDSDFVDIKKE